MASMNINVITDVRNRRGNFSKSGKIPILVLPHPRRNLSYRIVEIFAG